MKKVNLFIPRNKFDEKSRLNACEENEKRKSIVYNCHHFFLAKGIFALQGAQATLVNATRSLFMFPVLEGNV